MHPLNPTLNSRTPNVSVGFSSKEILNALESLVAMRSHWWSYRNKQQFGSVTLRDIDQLNTVRLISRHHGYPIEVIAKKVVEAEYSIRYILPADKRDIHGKPCGQGKIRAKIISMIDFCKTKVRV